MDPDAARALLGVGADVTPDELRAAYRARLRAAHPDLHGHDDGTADVVAAYRVLRETAAPTAGITEVDVEVAAVVVDGDTVTAELPAGDLFVLLVEAGEAIGHVTHADPAAGLLDVVVDIPGHGACSVVWTLQGRGTGWSESWCTVEPLGGGPPPPAATVTALLADGLRAVAGR